MNACPVLTVLVAVTHQAGGDRVAVGLVADQDAAQVIASTRVEGLAKSAKVSVFVDQFRDCFSESRASLVDG